MREKAISYKEDSDVESEVGSSFGSEDDEEGYDINKVVKVVKVNFWGKQEDLQLKPIKNTHISPFLYSRIPIEVWLHIFSFNNPSIVDLLNLSWVSQRFRYAADSHHLWLKLTHSLKTTVSSRPSRNCKKISNSKLTVLKSLCSNCNLCNAYSSKKLFECYFPLFHLLCLECFAKEFVKFQKDHIGWTTYLSYSNSAVNKRSAYPFDCVPFPNHTWNALHRVMYSRPFNHLPNKSPLYAIMLKFLYGNRENLEAASVDYIEKKEESGIERKKILLKTLKEEVVEFPTDFVYRPFSTFEKTGSLDRLKRSIKDFQKILQRKIAIDKISDDLDFKEFKGRQAYYQCISVKVITENGVNVWLYQYPKAVEQFFRAKSSWRSRHDCWRNLCGYTDQEVDLLFFKTAENYIKRASFMRKNRIILLRSKFDGEIEEDWLTKMDICKRFVEYNIGDVDVLVNVLQAQRSFTADGGKQRDVSVTKMLEIYGLSNIESSTKSNQKIQKFVKSNNGKSRDYLSNILDTICKDGFLRKSKRNDLYNFVSEFSNGVPINTFFESNLVGSVNLDEFDLIDNFIFPESMQIEMMITLKSHISSRIQSFIREVGGIRAVVEDLAVLKRRVRREWGVNGWRDVVKLCGIFENDLQPKDFVPVLHFCLNVGRHD